MAKKIDVIETPVVDPTAERVKIKAEIDGVVAGKIAAVIKVFQDGREKDIDELIHLNQALEDLKSKRATFLVGKDHLVRGIFGAGSKGVGDLDLKLRLLEKEINTIALCMVKAKLSMDMMLIWLKDYPLPESVIGYNAPMVQLQL